MADPRDVERAQRRRRLRQVWLVLLWLLLVIGWMMIGESR